jgi:hypothetical protein
MSSVSVMLDLLPNPNTHLHMYISVPISQSSAPSFNDPIIQKALSRSAQFWTSVSAQSNFVTGLCRSWFYPQEGVWSAHYIKFGYSRHEYELPQEEANTPGVHVSIEVADLLTRAQYLSLITDMHITMQEYDGDRKVQLDTGIDFDLCPSVKRLKLQIKFCQVYDASWQSCGALQELDRWIRKRDASGKPLACVCFHGCTSSLQPFFESLRDSQAARCVKWEDDS